jgi:hypothetical protein
MSEIKDNYQLLIQRLDNFIRKYYVNKLIKGALHSVALVLGMFITLSVLENYMYFSTSTRKILFLSFIGISIVAITKWIALPLMNYFRLGKVISHEKAASIIGNHFSNVKDKLLNVLQLKEQSRNSQYTDLINASINQKVTELNPVPFRSAINLSQNKKYLRFALPPLMLLVLILFIDASIIKNGTTRLIRNDEVFEREAPFKFQLQNKNLNVVQFEDFEIEVKVNGDVLPNEVFIDVDDYKYKLKKINDNTFTYKLNKVAKDTRFHFFASSFNSNSYDLSVLKKPNLVGFEVRLDYPDYTGRKDETVSNIGDLVIPAGTSISWTFESQNTDEVAVNFSTSPKADILKRIGKQRFSLQKRILKDVSYMVYVSNENLQKADSVNYSLSVTPDVHPNISVEQFEDSTQKKVLFFAGEVADDYGLSRLNFNYTLESEGGQSIKKSIPLKTGMGRQAQYDYTWDLIELGMKPGDKLTYFFEVFDNDAINGAKSAKTGIMTYTMPSVQQYEKIEEQNDDAIKEELKDAMAESKKLQEDVKKLQEKLLQKKELDWRDRKEIEKLLERQKELEQMIEDAKDKFKENLENQSQFNEPNEEINKKQEQLEELFNEVLDEEMKEIMRKMEELLQEMDKEKALEDLENMEMSDDQLENELDRMLELFKQMEFEKEMGDTEKKLEELAKKQEELSEDTEKGAKNDEQLKKEQQEINKEFKDIQEKMKDLNEKNEDLQNPMDMKELNEQSEDIQKEQEKSSQQLQQNKKNDASKSQKKASQKMKDMANSMNMMMQSAQMEQMQEDIAALRQLLENLVQLSFDQEKLMEDTREIQVNTPAYTSAVQQQYKLKDDFLLIEDSLNALAKRVFQIESFVTEKVGEMKRDFKMSIDQLEERKKSPAEVRQQRIMTGANDLALMLSEVMEQMQQQMANQMKGSQMCQKPGQGQPMMKMGEMQQQLNKQMEQMMQQMKDGKSPGEGKGKGKGKDGWSKDFAEAAAKQAAIRKALKEMQKEKMEQGKGSKELQNMIDEMDKVETDLVNKKLNTEMMKRQQDILTKLLEAAEAERKQEFENKRKSETAQNREHKKPKALDEYIKKRQAEIELYKSVSPSLNPYYKTLVEEYYNSLKGGQ